MLTIALPGTKYPGISCDMTLMASCEEVVRASVEVAVVTDRLRGSRHQECGREKIDQRDEERYKEHIHGVTRAQK